jgi:hypothetical protein
MCTARLGNRSGVVTEGADEISLLLELIFMNLARAAAGKHQRVGMW